MENKLSLGGFKFSFAFNQFEFGKIYNELICKKRSFKSGFKVGNPMSESMHCRPFVAFSIAEFLRLSLAEGSFILRMPMPSLTVLSDIRLGREQLSQALNCSCTSDLNTYAFTINLNVNVPVFSSDVHLQFRA